MGKSSWNSKNPWPPPNTEGKAITTADTSSWPRLRYPLVALIILATLGLSLYYYPALPEKIPTHFNAQGIPDGYDRKGIMVFMSVIMQIFISGLMAFSFWILKRQELDFASGRTPPWWMKSNWPLQRELMPKTRLMMDGIFFSILLLFAYLQYESIMVAIGVKARMGLLIWGFIVFILGWSLIWTVVILRESYQYQAREKAKHG